MEGLEEPLARMVENAYVIEAARGVTASMVSRGEKPSVISAIMKYKTTEGMRRSLNDAMDLHGGRGICDGQTNYLMAAYQAMPVAITVEGANILTRSLITFAQGALRSHPYLYKEIQACQDVDEERGLEAFDPAFCGHVAFSLSSAFGAFFHNVTFGLFGHVPEKAYGTAEWYRQLWRASRNFAFVADLTVAVLGGGLKTKQKLTGRLADALSELYLLCCVLKRYEDDGKPANDRHIVALAAHNGLFRFQEAMRGTIDNFPVTPGALADAGRRVPVRRALQAGAGLGGPQGRRAGAHPRRGPRPPHALHLRLQQRRRPDRAARGHHGQGGGRRGRREEARPRGARRPGAPRARHRLDRRCRQARHPRR